VTERRQGLGTVLGAVSMVAARYSANWFANHTYRVKTEVPMLAQMPRTVYEPSHSTYKAPNYYQRHTTDYSSGPSSPHRYRY
jgi:hypothetical protein